MDALSLAALLDVLSKGGVIGASAVFIWLLLTDRVQTRGHVQELKDGFTREITEKSKLIARLDERLKSIQNALERMHTPRPGE